MATLDETKTVHWSRLNDFMAQQGGLTEYSENWNFGPALSFGIRSKALTTYEKIDFQLLPLLLKKKEPCPTKNSLVGRKIVPNN